MFPDGATIYFDYQNGKYGFNTDPARGADTFVPFQDKLTISSTVSGIITHTAGSTYNFVGTNTIKVNNNMIGQKSINIVGAASGIVASRHEDTYTVNYS